jgi:hypothetical protein
MDMPKYCRLTLHQSETTIAHEILSAHLGFAVMSFGNRNDIDRGPKFSSFKPIKEAREFRDDFIRTVGGNPLDPTQPPKYLRRFDVENAIVLLVPKNVVDLSSLVKNPKDSNPSSAFKHIEWLNDTDTRCTIANGVSRIYYVNRVLCRRESDIIRKQQRIIDNKGPADKIKKAERIIQETNEILKTSSNWLVSVYDLGMSPPCNSPYI